MATATRVKQPDMVVSVPVPSIVKIYEVREQDGKEVSRVCRATHHDIRDKFEHVSQLDRIRLDLSVEEAQAIKISMCYSTSSKKKGIVNALVSALSSPPGTPASSAVGKDAKYGYNQEWKNPLAP